MLQSYELGMAMINFIYFLLNEWIIVYTKYKGAFYTSYFL
jgi:hypothetical protein